MPRATDRTPGSTDFASANAIRVFGTLCERLPARWYLLRNCTLNVDGQTHFVQLVILHRDHGIGLIGLRRDTYTFPDLAIRLTRAILEENGFDARYPGHLPIVFISTSPTEARQLPARIERAFAQQEAIGILDPGWADWAFQALRVSAEEVRQARHDGEAGGSAPNSVHVVVPRPQRWLFTGLAIGSAALLLVASGFLVAWTMMPLWQARQAAVSGVAARSDARLMSEDAVARYLGTDLATFRERRPTLEEKGFPKPLTITGGYDRRAVDRWIDAAAPHD